MHWGPAPDQNAYYKTHWEKDLVGTDFATDFHLFGLEWNENGITFLLDNEVKIMGFYCSTVCPSYARNIA